MTDPDTPKLPHHQKDHHPMTTPPGATLNLGGQAYSHPDLEPQTIPITDIHPYPNNPRRGDQDAITASIQDLGLYRAIIVQRSTHHVLAGNHTLQALTDLGADRVPVTWVDVDDIHAAAIVARDNLTSDLGVYDDAELLALLTRDEDVLALSGYDDSALDALRRSVYEPAGNNDPDDTPEVKPGPAISRPGDVWCLGPHRLAVGDATDPTVYDALVGDERVACIWTDPPYGVEYVGKTKDALRIKNDGSGDLAALLADSLAHAIRAARPGAAVYVAAPPGRQGFTFWQTLIELGVFRQTLIWVKDLFVLGHSDYHYKHETIYQGYTPGAVGRRGRGGDGWYGDHSQTSVLEFARPKRSKEHPTMKPVDLVAHCIRNSTLPGDLVLDPFGGSGTTLIACHREDRMARLIELDPSYADVICRRYQQHTGKLPVRHGEQVDFTQEN